MGEGHEAVLAMVGAHAAVPCVEELLRPRGPMTPDPPREGHPLGHTFRAHARDNRESAQDELRAHHGTSRLAPSIQPVLSLAGARAPEDFSGPLGSQGYVWLMDVLAEARGPHGKVSASLRPRAALAPPDSQPQGAGG